MQVLKIVGSDPWLFHHLRMLPISAANRLGKSSTPWQCIHAMFWVMVVVVASSPRPGASQTAVKIDFGQPAPQWLRESEDYWTHSGRWTTEYTLGPDFGTFSITLDKPGKHVVEVIDTIPADMKTRAGYSRADRLGKVMDPSNPTQPSEGRKFHFRGWTGPITCTEPRIEVDLSQNLRLIAAFELQK